jgi:hypothetical protein
LWVSLAGKVSDFVGGGCSLVTSINMFKKKDYSWKLLRVYVGFGSHPVVVFKRILIMCEHEFNRFNSTSEDEDVLLQESSDDQHACFIYSKKNEVGNIYMKTAIKSFA